MNKYIKYLLIPIMLFGMNSNSCYSMNNIDNYGNKNEAMGNYNGEKNTPNIRIPQNNYFKMTMDEYLLHHDAWLYYRVMKDAIKDMNKNATNSNNNDYNLYENAFCILDALDDMNDGLRHYVHYNCLSEFRNSTIPTNNFHVKTLNDLQLHEIALYNFSRQQYIDVIKFLTDIDISNIINGQSDDKTIKTIKENIINKIKNMKLTEFKEKMSKVITTVQIYYLPILYSIETLIGNIAEFCLTNMKTGDSNKDNAYIDAVFEAQNEKNDYYDVQEKRLMDAINKFKQNSNAEYK